MALPKQAFQEHSAVWEVILIRNTVENSTLPLDTHKKKKSSLPSPCESYDKPIFLFSDCAKSGQRGKRGAVEGDGHGLIKEVS